MQVQVDRLRPRWRATTEADGFGGGGGVVVVWWSSRIGKKMKQRTFPLFEDLTFEVDKLVVVYKTAPFVKEAFSKYLVLRTLILLPVQ